MTLVGWYGWLSGRLTADRSVPDDGARGDVRVSEGLVVGLTGPGGDVRVKAGAVWSGLVRVDGRCWYW